MKLLIIGATRGIGFNLLKQALERGYEVTVLLRDPSRLKLDHEQLTVIQGDIQSIDSVKQAVKGQEAVCVSIGIRPTTKPVTLFSLGTKNVIEAMKQTSVDRLICVTGIGAGESKNHGGFFYDKLILPLLLKKMYADKDRQEDMIKNSNLTWTIIRPGFLTNGLITGEYRCLTDLNGITAGKISRADVANFILREIEENKFVHKTPLLTY